MTMSVTTTPEVSPLALPRSLGVGPIRVACDSEFQGPHTLTIQNCMRQGNTLVVQMRHSPCIPGLPDDFRLDNYLPEALRKFCDRVILRDTLPIESDLSPVSVLAGLTDNHLMRPVSRIQGDDYIKQCGQLAQPLSVTFTAHYWAADFFRVFGSYYFRYLGDARLSGENIIINAQKQLGFKETNWRGDFQRDAVLEYMNYAGKLHPVKVRHFDTNLPFGQSRLDDLAKTFLGISKVDTINKAEKACMSRVFRERTADAYGYAAMDAIITLLLDQAMRQADVEMFQALGFSKSEIPAMRATQGSRVSDMILRHMLRNTVTGSASLSRKGTPKVDGTVSAVSMSKVKSLLHKGSGDFLAQRGVSKFGQQTGETHGGLLFSRTPTKLFHAAPGQFRDVDLQGCYASIITQLHLYAGRPVVYEPGPGMTLREAFTYVREHAAGNDAWVLKVTGAINTFPNSLIPSSDSALTHANYRNRRAKQHRRAKRKGFLFDWLYESKKATGNATLYSNRIEAGVVAWPTWLMIQAMPSPMREEYENLEVESIIFYPQQFVVDSGAAYDQRIAELATNGPGWTQCLDLEQCRQTNVEHLDEDYISIRYPIGELARTISQLRAQAKIEHGKGSAIEQSLKRHANSIYGVVSSRHLPTNNIVLANLITATARALAYAMEMSLNGFQVITDGCTYRRDQIPAGTFADCLSTHRNYPIIRPDIVDAAVEYVDVQQVPDRDEQFAVWYRSHVKRFFGVEGADYDELFGIHGLEHKTTGKPATACFDGLCADGSANYLKLARSNDKWEVLDFKARSFRGEEKDILAPWILRTYQFDNYTSPPPITECGSLLSYRDAVSVSRSTLEKLDAGKTSEQLSADPSMVYFPLGLAQTKVHAYKVIKPSAFIFQTPDQREKFVKAMETFSEKHGCGIEVLALRRGYGNRREGSIEDIARTIFEYIRQGGDNITRELNLTRRYCELVRVDTEHKSELLRRKEQARQRFDDSINFANLDDNTKLTGHYVQSHDIIVIRDRI